MRQLSNAAKQAVYSQETSEVFIILLTITSPDFLEPIRISSDSTELLPLANVRGTLSRDEEYVYLPFAIELPQQDETGVARAKISIDNIDRRMVQAVRTATSALSITVEIVLASSPDVLEMSVEDFRMERISYDALTISGDLSVEHFDLEPYSKLRFTPSNFPGMF